MIKYAMITALLMTVTTWLANPSYSHAHGFDTCSLAEEQVEFVLERVADVAPRIRNGDPQTLKELVAYICHQDGWGEEDLASLLSRIERTARDKTLPGRKVLSTNPLAILILIEVLAGKEAQKNNHSGRESN